MNEINWDKLFKILFTLTLGCIVGLSLYALQIDVPQILYEDFVQTKPKEHIEYAENFTAPLTTELLKSGKQVIDAEIPIPEIAYERIDTGKIRIYRFPEQDIIRGNSLEHIDAAALEGDIREILGENSEYYGVYVYDLVRRQEISINPDTAYGPGSISKVPVGLLVAMEFDKGTKTPGDYKTFERKYFADPTNVLTAKFFGTDFTLDQYMRFLIIDSDNASIRVLEDVVGGQPRVNELTRDVLGVDPFYRDPHSASAKAMGTVFKNLYEEKYLSHDWNEYFLNLLKNTHPSLQDGIPIGVPYGTTIAHKTGIVATYPGYAWNDAGIVYGEKTDYVIVVINSYVTIPNARYNIQRISKVVYDTLN